MFLIAGLGNPGEQYVRTRHNVGFMALNVLAAVNAVSPRADEKHRSSTAEIEVGEETALLAWPQTFMNKSGQALRSLVSYYDIPLSHVLVLHDDIDLPVGSVKIARSAGSAGHKGVESVIQELGSKEFGRVRIGILPESGKPEDVESFVLKRFSPTERAAIASLLEDRIPEIVGTAVSGGIERAMNIYNAP